MTAAFMLMSFWCFCSGESLFVSAALLVYALLEVLLSVVLLRVKATFPHAFEREVLLNAFRHALLLMYKTFRLHQAFPAAFIGVAIFWRLRF